MNASAAHGLMPATRLLHRGFRQIWYLSTSYFEDILRSQGGITRPTNFIPKAIGSDSEDLYTAII